jgi:hypothetical protein
MNVLIFAAAALWGLETQAQPTMTCDAALRSTYGCWESIPSCPEPPQPWPAPVACSNGFPYLEAIHMILTYTGKVLMWDNNSANLNFHGPESR